MQLPVFIHPTTPFTDGMGLADFGLGNTIGFTSDTSLCFAKLILEGVLDGLPNLATDRLPRWRRASVSRRALRHHVGTHGQRAQEPGAAVDVSQATLVRLDRLRPADARLPRRARRSPTVCCTAPTTRSRSAT